MRRWTPNRRWTGVQVRVCVCACACACVCVSECARMCVSECVSECMIKHSDHLPFVISEGKTPNTWHQQMLTSLDPNVRMSQKRQTFKSQILIGSYPRQVTMRWRHTFPHIYMPSANPSHPPWQSDNDLKRKKLAKWRMCDDILPYKSSYSDEELRGSIIVPSRFCPSMEVR